MRISIIHTVANLCFIYKFIGVCITVSLKAVTVYQVTKIPGWCSSQSADIVELMLRKMRTACAEERHVLIRSRELSERSAPMNTLWKQLVNCTPRSALPRTLVPLAPPKGRSLCGREGLTCPGDAQPHAASTRCPTKGHSVGAGVRRAQPLAAQILQNKQTSSQGDCLFIKLFHFLVYKINTSGYTCYVTFYAYTSSTTIRCFY